MIAAWWSDPAALAALASGLAVVVGLVGWRLRGPRSLDVDVDAPAADQPRTESGGLVARLREAMGSTGAALRGQFDRLFGGDRVDLTLLDPLEEALLRADVGVPTTERLLKVARKALEGGETDPAVLREVLREEMRTVLRKAERTFSFEPTQVPLVVLVVGVNGSGKTTTIGKLAARFGAAGKRVVMAAGDTYRAAAADQLAVWAERSGAVLFRREEGADPASVVHDAMDAAIRDGADVVLIDTAGRLQTARPLMEQLTKIRRVIDKKVPGAPHETLLILDGTMGQNAMSQARTFHEATPLTGVVVTKLDGTARGGMILGVAAELSLSVLMIGIGERLEDLRAFEADAFIEALT